MKYKIGDKLIHKEEPKWTYEVTKIHEGVRQYQLKTLSSPEEYEPNHRYWHNFVDVDSVTRLMTKLDKVLK